DRPPMFRMRNCKALMLSVFAWCAGGNADAQQQQRPSVKKPPATAARPAPLSEAALRQQINEWTVGLAGGLLEGAPIRLATEIARVVNEGPNLHVLPIVTRGPTENVNDLLYL